jgi:hypothetical protein
MANYTKNRKGNKLPGNQKPTGKGTKLPLVREFIALEEDANKLLFSFDCNLTDSEGYGRASRYKAAKSLYEMQEDKLHEQTREIETLKAELQAAEELLNNK